jgi:hypothetical protein
LNNTSLFAHGHVGEKNGDLSAFRFHPASPRSRRCCEVRSNPASKKSYTETWAQSQRAAIYTRQPEHEFRGRWIAVDLYQLGPHRLICGDGHDPAVVQRLMQTDVARLVFTDLAFDADLAGPAALHDDTVEVEIRMTQFAEENIYRAAVYETNPI